MPASSTFGTLFNIIMVGGVWCVLAFVVVKLNAYANTMGLGADAMNTIFFLEVAFMATPVLVLIAYVINHWINSKNAANTGV